MKKQLRNFNSSLIFAILSGIVLIPAAQSQVLYNFDAFTPLPQGLTGGNDGWTTPTGGTIQVVANPDGPGNMAIAPATTDAYARKEFSSLGYTSATTDGIFQADFRWVEDMPSSNSQVRLMAGIAGTSGLAMGFRSPSSGTQELWMFALNASGVMTNRVSTVPASFEHGDWISLKFEIDFTANDGDGSASLFYMNLTQGDTSWIAASANQTDVNMNLSTVPGISNPEAWNAMTIRANTANSDQDYAMGINNLYTAIPEPGVTTLLLLTLLGTLLLRRRRLVKA